MSKEELSNESWWDRELIVAMIDGQKEAEDAIKKINTPVTRAKVNRKKIRRSSSQVNQIKSQDKATKLKHGIQYSNAMKVATQQA